MLVLRDLQSPKSERSAAEVASAFGANAVARPVVGSDGAENNMRPRHEVAPGSTRILECFKHLKTLR